MFPREADRWRWHVKVAMASAIAGASQLHQRAIRAREQRRPLILGYHRVVEDFMSVARTEMPSMLISRAMFERHIEWIGRSFRFVSLDEIGEHVRSGRPFSSPVAAITFDDGYQDVYEHAFPLLRRKGIPAAMFVVTDLIGRPAWQIHDKLYYLVDKAFAAWDDPPQRLFDLMTDLRIPPAHVFRNRASASSSMMTVSSLLPALPQAEVSRLMGSLEACVGNGRSDIPLSFTWPMIHEMRRSGITIASHTKSHVSLPMETPAAAREELEGSRLVLERELGEPIRHFAYPGGEFTPQVVDALSETGYEFAYTACPHGDPRQPALTQPRLLLWEGSSVDADGEFSSPVLNCQMHDLWPPARRCERTHRKC
jgi:peptidoglycan/xylan/chitin deacetylase (PgdA/CDA1 family)